MDIQDNDTEQNDNQHNNKANQQISDWMVSRVMLNDVSSEYRIFCYAECYLNSVIMLSVVQMWLLCPCKYSPFVIIHYNNGLECS